MNLVYGLALHEFSIAQWIECPPGVWEIILGSNPVGDSDFFFVPRSQHADYFHLHNIVSVKVKIWQSVCDSHEPSCSDLFNCVYGFSKVKKR